MTVLGIAAGVVVALLAARVLLPAWPSKGCDRWQTGNADGHLYATFDPPWWHVVRWVRWWTLRWTRPDCARGRITVIRDGVLHEVRCYEVKPKSRAVRVPTLR